MIGDNMAGFFLSYTWVKCSIGKSGICKLSINANLSNDKSNTSLEIVVTCIDAYFDQTRNV